MEEIPEVVMSLNIGKTVFYLCMLLSAALEFERQHCVWEKKITIQKKLDIPNKTEIKFLLPEIKSKRFQDDGQI